MTFSEVMNVRSFPNTLSAATILTNGAMTTDTMLIDMKSLIKYMIPSLGFL